MPEALRDEAARDHLGAVARGSTATVLGAAASTVASFGLVVLITRTVDPTTAGTFFASTAVFLVALATAGLGTETGLARFVLRTEDPAAVRNLMRMAAGPVLVAATALALLLAVVAPDTRPLVWALPGAAAADLCLATVRAHASFRSTVVVDRLVRPTLQVLLVGIAVAAGAPGGGIAAAWAAAYVVTAVLSVRAVRARVPAKPDERGTANPTGPGRRAFWSFTAPRAVARVAQVCIQKIDIVLVAWMLTPADAAVYTVATRFVIFGQLANQAVSSVVQPRFTMILADPAASASTLGRVFSTSACWSVLMAWPVYLCVAAAPAGYLGWFGPGYTGTDAAVTAVAMSVGMLVAVASGPVDTLLLMAGGSMRSLLNTLVALAVDVALCLLLVPSMGIAGAAVAWVTAVVLRCFLAVLQLRGEVRLAPDPGALVLACALPLACVGAPVAVLEGVVGLGPPAWLLACLAVGAVYVATVWHVRDRLAVDVFVAGLRSRSAPGVVA